MKTSHFAVLTSLLISITACQNGAMGTMIPTTPSSQSVQMGVWGGSDIGMDVMQTGATVEFDCAQGTIDEAIMLDAMGRFAVDGVYLQEGGPVGGMGSPMPVPARYQGDVVGQQMTLTVTNLDTQMKIGAFSLTFGASANIVKCL